MAPRELLVATRNPGKIKEFQELLTELDYTVVSLEQFPDIPDVAETGTTFAENALIKSRFYHAHTGMLALSDDSGLAVDALGGAPGVYSARYAGPHADDRQRYEKLLRELQDLPDEQRTARFICTIALTCREFEEVFTGISEGIILRAPRGEGGFGYDPIFQYPPLSKTFAELSRAEKAQVSHRGRALAQVREFLSRQPWT